MTIACRIELFGGLRVHVGGRVITRFQTQKTASLLAYMAYYISQSHPREVLIDLLWPEAEPKVGRHRLNMALSSLRRQLEPPGVPAGAIVQADRFHVHLNSQATITDVAEFESSLRQDNLQLAIAVYHGPLLPGFYEEWITPQAVRLEELYHQALRQWEAMLQTSGPSFPATLPRYGQSREQSRSRVPTADIHLPVQFTRFFGREEEIARLVQMLTCSPPHLLTLTGPGGSGKSRLAQEVARKAAEAFVGGVWFVPLADLAHPRQIPEAIMEAVRLPRSANVELLDQLAGSLNARAAPALLLLDNMEHLLSEDRRKSEDGARWSAPCWNGFRC